MANKIKKASKYVSQEIIDKAYAELKGFDLILFTILHTTGMRISEVSEYLEKVCNMSPTQQSVKLTPAKKNWDRVLPIVLNESQIEMAKSNSWKTDTLRKRIHKWNYGFSAHDMRATFISNAYAKDINIVKIQRLVGHKELSSTLKYLRITTEHDLWLYDYIIERDTDFSESTDIAMLKQRLGVLAKQNAKLKYKLKKGATNGSK